MRAQSPEELIERWQEFFQESGLLNKILALADAFPEERSLTLDFSIIDHFDADLAIHLLEHPQTTLFAAEEAMKRVVPPAEEIPEPHFRVQNLPKDGRVEIRDLRSKHLAKFISVAGLVRKATEVRPKVVVAIFECMRCHAIIKEEQDGLGFREPLECYRDQGGCERAVSSTKFQLAGERSRFLDTQKIEIQEPPEGLRGGEQPQRLVAYLDDDLTGKINPGTRVILSGILRSVQKGRAPAKSTLFDIFLDACSIELQQVEFEEIEVTPEDVAKIRAEAQDPEILTKIVNSIAPSIYGLGTEKEALALQLFGGVAKQMPDGRRMRGDIHCLLVGDPGTAKSELLSYMSRLSPRGIYATGQAASGPGLTAAAVRDEFGEGRWTLEAGALVLADKGLACLHPDSEVFADGLPIAIKTLFDEKHGVKAWTKGNEIEIAPLNKPTVSLDLNNLEVQNSQTSLITRRFYKGPILHATLDSGFELRLTPNHLVLEGGTLHWKQIRELSTGSTIVAIQRLPGHHEPVFVLDILPDNWFVRFTAAEWNDLRAEILQRFGTFAEADRVYGLSGNLSNCKALTIEKFRSLLGSLGIYNLWRARPFTYGRARPTERLRVGTVTPQLAYIMGFIYGDGYIRRSHSRYYVSIFQSRTHLRQIQRLLQVTKSVSSRKWGMQQRNTETIIRGKTVRCQGYQMERYSCLFAFIYDWLTGDDLKNVLRLDDDALCGFIAGVTDSDGLISIKSCYRGSTKYHSVDAEFLVSSSRRPNLRLMYALRRLDIFSRLRRAKGVYRIQITSRADIERLLHCIAPYSVKWKNLPSRKTRISARHEEVPRSPLREILLSIHPDPYRLIADGISSTFYEFRHSTRIPYKQPLRTLIKTLEPWATREQHRRLKALGGSDYALDRIKSIEVEQYEGYVYDLRVPKNENFLCDSIAGHNCVDEIEKMNPQDRSSIHEILEQQRLSVAKAGITAVLQARCSLLAAANPKFGRFNESKYISEQIDLSPPLLSRFDLIFPIFDKPEANRDRAMAEHILRGHLVGEMYRKQEQDTTLQIDPNLAQIYQPHFPPDFLRKYVACAKRIYPIMTPDAMKAITNKYLEIRRQGEMEGGAVPITPRQLEAFVRLSEASARARLSQLVTVEDAERAVRIVEYWLQKVTGIEGRFDIDIVATGVSQSQREQIIALRDIIQNLAGQDGTAELQDILEQSEQRGIPPTQVEKYLKQWSQQGEVYSPSKNKYRLIQRS